MTPWMTLIEPQTRESEADLCESPENLASTPEPEGLTEIETVARTRSWDCWNVAGFWCLLVPLVKNGDVVQVTDSVSW
jgi:hypothetical protein